MRHGGGSDRLPGFERLPVDDHLQPAFTTIEGVAAEIQIDLEQAIADLDTPLYVVAQGGASLLLVVEPEFHGDLGVGRAAIVL